MWIYLNVVSWCWMGESPKARGTGGSQASQCGSVQFSLSVLSDSVTPWIAARQASLSITKSQSLLKLMSIESVMPSNHLILCHPLLLLPPIPPSIRVFSNESTLRMKWPKYWSFSFSISPSNEHPGLISFRMDWLDLLAVQGTFKCLLQHHSSEASIFWLSAFFTVQLSHPYMTTGKTIALTRWTFVGKVMSLLLNMLSRLVITFLPRSKHLLISLLQSSNCKIYVYLILWETHLPKHTRKGEKTQEEKKNQYIRLWGITSNSFFLPKNFAGNIYMHGRQKNNPLKRSMS